MASAPKPDQVEYYQPEKLLDVDYERTPERDWMSTPAEIRPGNFIWPAKPKNLEYVGFPNAHDWSPLSEDCPAPRSAAPMTPPPMPATRMPCQVAPEMASFKRIMEATATNSGLVATKTTELMMEV